MNEAEKRLIVALDVLTAEEAIYIVDELGELVEYYKVDVDMFYGMGHAVLAQLMSRGKKIFFDLKLHDIPTMVTKTVKTLCQFNPAFLTLHAAGGAKMLKAAVQAADEWAIKPNRLRPKLLAITVLTSIGESDWVDIGYQSPIRESVLRMSMLCKEVGLDGVIASPQEAAAIRALCGSEFIIATPGLRLGQEAHADQSRIATPAQALKVGADYLIMGRSIVASPSPRQTVEAILMEMEG